MKKNLLIILFICTLIIQHSWAAGLSIQPLYGVERTQRQFPEPPKYVTKTFVGMAAIYGVPLISAELEVGQSITKDDFPSDNMEVTYTTQRAMLGIRSYPIHSQMLGIFFRAGARAQKEVRDITKNGEKTTEENPINFDPYAGTGLTFVLGDNFALNAGATLVYNRDASASEQYDTQYTFSFTIKAGSTR